MGYKQKEVKINTPFIKLDQLLKFAGLTETGGNAKEVIAEGRINVCGEPCTVRGKKIFPGDTVEVPEIDLQLKVTGGENV